MPRSLRKVPFVVTKDYSVSDKRQIPAASSINVFFRGATLAAAKGFTNGETNIVFSVRDTGEIAVNDTLACFDSAVSSGLSAASVTVVSVDSHTQITANSNSDGADTWGVGDRIIIKSKPGATAGKPTWYTESTGIASSSQPLTTSSALGTAEGYFREKFVDAIITGADFDPKLQENIEAGETGHIINAGYYPSIQAAINAARPGSTIYVPSGNYSESITLNKDYLTLIGDGCNKDPHLSSNGGTQLSQTSPATTVITVTGDQCKIQNIRIQGSDADSGYTSTPGGAPVGGHGILVYKSGGRVTGTKIEDVQVANVGTDGINLLESNWAYLERVECVECRGSGVFIYGGAQITLSDVFSHANNDFGIYCEATSIHVMGGIGVEQNQQVQAGKAEPWDCNIRFKLCNGTVERIDVEEWVKTTTKTGMVVEGCTGFCVNSVLFVKSTAGSPGERGVYVSGGSGISIISVNGYNAYELIHLNYSDLPDGVFVGQVGKAAGNCGVTIGTPAQRANKNIFALSLGMFLPVFTTAGKVAAASTIGSNLIWVTDPATAGQNLQVCDGTNWKYIALNTLT